MTKEPFVLNEDELIITTHETNPFYNMELTTEYDLKTVEGAKEIVTILNGNERYINNLTRHYKGMTENLKKEVEIHKQENERILDAIETIEGVYEFTSKEKDFNTKIISLIKRDCIKEIRKQLELNKLKDMEVKQ